MRIYIAGPYSADSPEKCLENVTKAIDAGLAVWKKGHRPYVPHLTHFVDQRARIAKIPMKWNDYIEWDKAWLDVCDALLFIGSSRGAEIELEYAKKMGKKIFFSVNSVPNNCKESSIAIEQ